MTQMRNGVPCTRAEGAETKGERREDVYRQICQELAITWPWGLREEEVTGMHVGFLAWETTGWNRDPWIH